MPRSIDPIALARIQLASDRAIDRTAAGLFAVKHGRMCASAFAFLRGSAPLFYRILREHPELGRGPEGGAWLTGDLHVQNFGAYRTDDARPGRTRVVFGPNDFDEACVGPVRIDLLRLAVSWLLALDERGLAASARVASCRALVDGWNAGAFGARLRARAPRAVTALIARVEARTKASLHRSYLRGSPRKRALQRDARLWPISRATAVRAREAFAGYAARAGLLHDAGPDHFEVLDVARRVAGTGSLGVERFAVLSRGGARGEWIFDVKEEAARSASGLPAEGLRGAARVVRAIVTSALAPPRMLGTTVFTNARGERASMLVRRLSPQEDKLDPAEEGDDEREPLAHYLGWIAGRMHRRGAVGPLGRAWPRSERDALLERAITLAGLHEAIQLAYVALRARS